MTKPTENLLIILAATASAIIGIALAYLFTQVIG